MATIDEQRHQMIRRIVMHRHDSTATDTILLWERLACELTAIIGHAGFDTLYVRAAHLARGQHPGLPVAAGPNFDLLRKYLLQSPVQAMEVNIPLLTILIATSTRLNGDPLTTTILHAACGTDAVDTTGKELQQWLIKSPYSDWPPEFLAW